jgi:sirohydrochlorin cobaltochelatase
MAQGGHLKHDLPKILGAIRESYPHVPISLETAIGEVPEILAAVAQWVIDRSE